MTKEHNSTWNDSPTETEFLPSVDGGGDYYYYAYDPASVRKNISGNCESLEELREIALDLFWNSPTAVAFGAIDCKNGCRVLSCTKSQDLFD